MCGELITNYVNMMNVGGACVGFVCVRFVCVEVCVELVWGGVYVGGVCVGRVYVGGVCVGRVKKNFNLSLSFVIPVNKMNLKSLPLPNHIPYKSKEPYLLHQQFKKVHSSIALYNLFQNEMLTCNFDCKNTTYKNTG